MATKRTRRSRRRQRMSWHACPCPFEYLLTPINILANDRKPDGLTWAAYTGNWAEMREEYFAAGEDQLHGGEAFAELVYQHYGKDGPPAFMTIGQVADAVGWGNRDVFSQ